MEPKLCFDGLFELLTVPTDYLNCIFRMQTNMGTGTCFFVRKNGESYIVSVRHLLENVKKNEKIFIHHADRHFQLECTSVKLCKQKTDLAFIKCTSEVSIGFEVKSGSYFLGQDVLVAGFPLSLNGKGIDESLPPHVPLVKKGCFSGVIQRSYLGKKGMPKHDQTLVDFVNTSGFSGAPVFANIEYDPRKYPNLVLVGVVSGYLFDKIPQEIHHSGTSISSNSGFTTLSGVNYLLELMT